MRRSPRGAPLSPQGVAQSILDCQLALQQLSSAASPLSTRSRLRLVADSNWHFFSSTVGQFGRMLDTINHLPIPRVDVGFVRHWFGDIKQFPHIDLLLQIISEGAPVHVSGHGDLRASLVYGNHNSTRRFTQTILDKVVEDVTVGQAFVFPRTGAAQIPGLRVSPLTVAESPSKTRVCHDLSTTISGPSVNAETDTSVFPDCKIGHVLRSVLWRILFLHSKFVLGQATPPRTLLAKQDTKNAFRQVAVQVDQAPTFGYVFEDVVVIDRYLQFGWTSSPSVWGVCAAAVEHAHNRTSFQNAVVTPEGCAATSHVQIIPPRSHEVRAQLPPDCVYPPDRGGGIRDPFWVSTYVDDALFVEVESVFEGRRCLRASQSFASDSFRLLGSRTHGEPPLFSQHKITSWDTRMDMLGWSIDTVAMSISVSQEKVAQLRATLAQWPVDRRVASVREVRSLVGKLLYLSEVVRPGNFFVRRILNQLGLPPLKGVGGDERFVARGPAAHTIVHLGKEFHADLAFWHLALELATGPDGVTLLSAPLFACFLQPPSRILISDASGDAMGGYCLESGQWWRIDFSDDIRSRLRQRVGHRDDLSMNVFELLGMVITAWALTVHAGDRPAFPGQSVLMLGDNMSAVHWINKCRGAREPRSGA